MKIYDYIIPKELQENQFIQSLYEQYERSGKLSPKQLQSLRNWLDIEDDFFDLFKPIPESSRIFKQEYHDLIQKLKDNRFRYVVNKNLCIKAINSILSGNPDSYLIDRVLYPPKKTYWR